MSYESEISLHVNDFGYSLEFKAEDEEGTVVPLNFLSGISGLWFKVISGLSYVMWQDNASGHFVVNNASGGLFEYVVQSGMFDEIGVYEGKVQCRFSGGILLTLDDLRISCVGRP